jgi:hypothetical protein
MTTDTKWRVAGSDWLDDQPDSSTIVIELIELDSGEAYTVSCSGPKGMMSNQFITAIRAAAAALIQSCGGDMSAVGASAARRLNG